MLKKYSASPYVLWCILFIVIPLMLILVYSFTAKDMDSGSIIFSLENYKRFLDPLFINVFLKSVTLALKATLLCLVIGYPMAMILSGMNKKMQRTAVLLFILPMWMNFLLRTYAWVAILGNNGILNRFFKLFGFSFNLMYNEGAVLLGMVYNFLPFMVLPIYTVLTKIDFSLIEAAEDLGASRKTVLRKIIFPLSMPGVLSGITMVFMPAVSTFVISNLLGGSKQTLIGNLVEQQFLVLNNWHFGSSISVILMVFILLFMAILNRADKDNEGGVSLW